ncbi:Predicted arabinose efflux permease, MFS family [Shimia gijangensis]|uniref:Predicted arabinose efflux permease, MFS family n=1 Tax=Shimia gijangensis TaxID=1470563 RepID=A0A1M6JQ77_9RHOB|nr:MFS transporter [Shimia gijangensis]SHJ48743.1 Predicted arabinose efflux permease, MFS family [Shimia gijangensis]
MSGILSNTTFRRLFAAQVVALTGTGLLTVALGLLAYDLAGQSAGAVLGTAYTIKMIAYVGLSPVAGAIAARLPRKQLLIVMDLVRAGVALCLPFVDAVWQVYVLIFLLQSASATFTPAFQAVIPDVLPHEADYTRALSLSRLAYDLENLVSPALAGLLLLVMDFHWLFAGTVVGFLWSTLLIQIADVPPLKTDIQRPFFERVTRGSWIYLATPRLRGLLAFNFAAASAGAFVLVNTVVMVRVIYDLGESHLAYAMAAFGAGSMLAALSIPRLLDYVSDRKVMSLSAFALSVLTLSHAMWFLVNGALPWHLFLLAWLAVGVFYSAILTPSGRLLRRSAHSEDRPAVFTAQFALSHACWLVTYPMAGWVAKLASLPVAMGVLGIMALIATVTGLRLWPQSGEKNVAHSHPDLPEDHPHLKAHNGARHHLHEFVIDDAHRVWPTQG